MPTSEKPNPGGLTTQNFDVVGCSFTLLNSIMTYVANAAQLEFPPSFPAQTPSSSTVSKAAGHSLAGDFHFGRHMVISGQDTGFDELLRRN